MEDWNMELQPALKGKLIELRPIRADDFEELYQCASDPDVWRQHPQSNRYQRDIFLKFFEGALASKGALVAIDLASKKIIGSSRYYNFNPDAGHLTIGYTFLSRDYWGGKFNQELKALMLAHAFQFVNFVLFEIGEQNLRSRRAIEKIGARLFKHETLDNNSHVIYKMDRNQFDQLTQKEHIEEIR